jgi:DNA repair photolyase
MTQDRLVTLHALLAGYSPQLVTCSVCAKVSVAIYTPTGRALEYAPLAANMYKGCSHCCRYCYVPGASHGKLSREEFDAAAIPRPGWLDRLRKNAKKLQAAGITEQVVLCFSTDAYNPSNTSLTRPTIEILIEHGLAFCVLTKGGSRALVDIDLYRPERDCFAATLTSLNAAFSLKWEPRAALPDDRIATLKTFHDKGIFTWVSLEPVLDVESSLKIVEETHEYVDLYKIGRANYLPSTTTTNWRNYTLRMVDLCQQLGVKHYIKRDLQQYLPAGYRNPLRVAQHN